jgi:hypothetical protein
MPSADSPDSRETGTSGVRYFKHLDPAPNMIHIEREGSWENISLSDGALLVRSTHEFSKELLARFEEIDEAEAMRLLGEGAARFRREEEERNRPVAVEQRGTPSPAGIGGWLVLPILGLCLTAIFALVRLVRDVVPTMQADAWSQLPISARALITFECFVTLALIVGPIALLTLLFLRRRILPRLMVAFYVLVFSAVLADSIGVLVVGPQLIPDAMVREEVGWSWSTVGLEVSRHFWFCAIWIPYFLVSKRVKNTCIKPQVPAPVFQTSSAVQPPLAPAVIGTVTPSALRTGTAERPRATRAWVLGASLAIVVAVLGVLVWKCATPAMDEGISESARTTPSGSVNVRTYTDSDYGYSFEYPSSWLLERPTMSSDDKTLSVIRVYDPFGTGTDAGSFTVVDISLIELGLEYEDSMLSDYKRGMDDAVAEMADVDPTFVLIEPTSETTVAGIESLLTVYAYSFDGIPLRAAEYFVPKGSSFYSIIAQAANEDWTKNQAVFDALLKSFKTGAD